MNTKKTKKSDLERQRSVFFKLGLIIAISLVIVAFEWKSPIGNINSLGTLIAMNDNLELPPITLMNQDIKPPIPKTIITEFKIVENNKEIIDTVTLISTEANDTTKILSYFFNNTVEDEVIEKIGYHYVETKPLFDGGEAGLLKYIASTTNYPKLAKENGISGTVWIGFTINEKGKIEDTKVLRSIDKLLDAEALRVIKSLPDWKPGLQAGKPVKVSFEIPIKFKLY